MRKSSAPSMRKALKRYKDQREESVSSATASNNGCDDTWGTSESQCSSRWDEKQHENYKNVLENKKVFNIVWREISTKKNKTWKGDGTLEVDIRTCKAILKDDTGKYLGSCGKVKCDELDEDLEMTVGNKEIQILDQVTTIADLSRLKQQQFENRGWGKEECLMDEDTFKKSKGAYVFKCPLNVDRPQLQDRRQGSKVLVESVHVPVKAVLPPDLNKGTLILKEYLCLLRPSELQQILLEKVEEYYSWNKATQKEEVLGTLEDICSHPSLINKEKVSNSIANFLQPHLPEWSDMGPCDSTKLEFLQYFISVSVLKRKERTIIIANHNKVLNMVQGFIDYLNIKNFRLRESNSSLKNTEILDDFNSFVLEGSVVFVESKALQSDMLEVSNLICFNCRPGLTDITNRIRNSKSMLHVYHLITTNCYELFVLQSLLIGEPWDTPGEKALDLSKNLNVEDLVKCLNLSKSARLETKWEYFNAPFTETVIQEAKLQEIGDNLLAILFGSKKSIE